MKHILEYYANHGKITDLGEQAACLEDALAEIPELVRLTQNLLIHSHIAEFVYGVKLSNQRKTEENNIRKPKNRLLRYQEIDTSPLATSRPYEKRVVGTCRDFAVVFTALLRQKGIPARARCGFATYFIKPFEDHWVTEYWHAEQQRWVLVDPQIDQQQRAKMNIRHNTLDMSPEHFVNGAEAWQMCRSGEADPEDFGIFDMKGLWFVRGNLVRDYASINKMELLPWDIWGLIAGDDEDISETDLLFLDRIAELAAGGDQTFDEMRSIYEGDVRVKPGNTIQAFIDGALREVKLEL